MRYLFLFVFVLLAACSEPNQTSTQVDRSGQSHADADQAWAGLTQPWNTPVARLEGEGGYAYFSRQIELFRQNWRTKGLEYWRSFPDDPRRYQWLIATVHMAPVYPENISLWAEGEDQFLGPNTVSLNDAERVKWEREYAGLREVFLNSPNVTEQERRYFLYGELVEEFFVAQRAFVRGTAIEPEQLQKRFLDFIGRYPEPFPDASVFGIETSIHRQMVETSFALLVFAEPDMMEWDEQSLSNFFHSVEALSPSPITRNRGNPNHPDIRYRDIPSVLETVRRDVSAANWAPQKRYNGEVIDENTARNRAWSLTRIREPIHHQSASGGARTAEMIALYHRVQADVRYAELGASILRSHPDSTEQFNWLRSAPGFANYFGDDISSFILSPYDAARESRPSAWRLDWEQRRATFEEWLIAGSDVPQLVKGEISGIRFNRIVGELARTVDSDRRIELIDELVAAIETHKDRRFDPSHIGPMINVLVKASDRFLLSVQDVERVLDSADDVRDPSIELAVQTFDERLNFLEGGTVALAGPLFGGGDFKLEELRGKIVYIDPWTTTCSPCIAAMPDLHKTYLEYKDRGLEFVSLVYNGADDPRGVQRYLDLMGLTWPIVIGDDLPGPRLPYLLLNRDGTVFAFHNRSEESLEDLLDRLLDSE